MGADTHGEPFYKNPPKQQNTIASFDDACEAVAKRKNFVLKTGMSTGELTVLLDVIKEAAELYAESKAREAWDRACEAMQQEALKQPCKMCGCSFESHQDNEGKYQCPEFFGGQLYGWADTYFTPDYESTSKPEYQP